MLPAPGFSSSTWCSLVVFSKASREDVVLARQLILQAKMNPLSVSQDHLLIARRDGSAGKDNELLGFGQIRPLTNNFDELASLYVLPEFRRQGVGKALIQELLVRHDERCKNNSGAKDKDVCLLTIRPTVSLYQKFGFIEVEDISSLPTILQMEYKAGSIISKILNNQLVCMVRRQESQC